MPPEEPYADDVNKGFALEKLEEQLRVEAVRLLLLKSAHDGPKLTGRP